MLGLLHRARSARTRLAFFSVRSFSTQGGGQVGFIGLGNMGKAMATNIIAARGHAVVFDVNPQSVQELVAKGAVAASSPATVVQQATTVITMLPSPKIVADVYDVLISAAPEGTMLVDCSTIDPATAKRVASECAAQKLHFVDAPVSGGVIGAANATLTFMAGGDAGAVKEAEKTLALMGKSVVHCGDSGAGQAAKLCNNLLLGITMGAVCEAMHLGIRLGVDAKVLAQVINSSSGRSWSSDTYNPCPGVEMMGVPSTRNYEGGFACDLMLKDLNLARDAASTVDLSMPLASSAHQVSTRCPSAQPHVLLPSHMPYVHALKIAIIVIAAALHRAKQAGSRPQGLFGSLPTTITPPPPPRRPFPRRP